MRTLHCAMILVCLGVPACRDRGQDVPSQTTITSADQERAGGAPPAETTSSSTDSSSGVPQSSQPQSSQTSAPMSSPDRDDVMSKRDGGRELRDRSTPLDWR